MLYASDKTCGDPAALDFISENCWELLKSRPKVSESRRKRQSSQPTAYDIDRGPAPRYCISTRQSSSSKKLSTSPAAACPGLSQNLPSNLDVSGLGLLHPPSCQFRTQVPPDSKGLFMRGRDTSSLLTVCNDDTITVVGSLNFLATRRYGTHARGSASQYGFIETTEPRNAFWLLVSDFTSSARHPLTLPQIPSTRLAPTSPSLHLPRLLQVPLYSMTTNPNF
jgi:hypothetical protein